MADLEPLYWQTQGNAGALPDLVLDHGGGGSSDDWRVLAPLLAQHTRVFRYDRAGMGRSARDGRGCSAAAVAMRLEALVERMQVRKPFVLIGYSLGGLYAQDYAARHPEQIAGLVLLDTTPTGFPLDPARVRRALRLLRLLHGLARVGLARLLVGKQEHLQRAIAQMRAPDWLSRMREEIDAIAGVQAEVAQRATRLRHPTLAVLAGARNRETEAEFVRFKQLQRELMQTAPAPLSQVVAVAGAHHGSLLIQHADEVAAHILAFARSLR